MNEYQLYALLGVAAIALIGAFYWLIKVRPHYLALKRSIRQWAETARDLNPDIEEASNRFRLKLAVGGSGSLPPLSLEEIAKPRELSRRIALKKERRVVRGIRYDITPEMVSRAKELSDSILEELEVLNRESFPSIKDEEWFQRHEEMYQVGEEIPGILGFLRDLIAIPRYGLWLGLRAIIILNRDRVLAKFFPHPRGNLARLRRLDGDWANIVSWQQKLLKLLQKLPGSAEFLDAKEKARLEKKAEKERERLALASIDQAKERLQEVMEYVRLRHSERSLAAGEPPVTAGATNLTLAMLEEYYASGLKKVEEMQKRSISPAEIVGYITVVLLPNLQGLFEEKAKKVAGLEQTAGEIKELEDELRRRDARVRFPEETGPAIAALSHELPNLWAEANWRDFDARAEAVTDVLGAGRDSLKEMQAYLKDIDSLSARIAGVKAKEARLYDTYGHKVPVSTAWEGMHANFETKAMTLWSEARLDELDRYLGEADKILRQYQKKTTDHLAEADREAGIAPDEDEVQTKLSQIASAAEAEPTAPPPRRSRHLPDEDRPRLTGKLVKVTTALGIEIEVDESQAEHYRQMDDKHKEEEKQRRQREGEPSNGKPPPRFSR